jgi:hypothetical protein
MIGFENKSFCCIVAAIIELSIRKLPIIVNQLGLVLESVSKVSLFFYVVDLVTD